MAVKPESVATPTGADRLEAVEAQKQQLMALLVWGEEGGGRDKSADAETCGAQARDEPAPGTSLHGLAALQRWMQCMEKLGWKRKW